MFVCFNRSVLLWGEAEEVGWGWSGEGKRKREERKSGGENQRAFSPAPYFLSAINLTADGADAATQEKCKLID